MICLGVLCCCCFSFFAGCLFLVGLFMADFQERSQPPPPKKRDKRGRNKNCFVFNVFRLFGEKVSEKQKEKHKINKKRYFPEFLLCFLVFLFTSFLYFPSFLHSIFYFFSFLPWSSFFCFKIEEAEVRKKGRNKRRRQNIRIRRKQERIRRQLEEKEREQTTQKKIKRKTKHGKEYLKKEVGHKVTPPKEATYKIVFL